MNKRSVAPTKFVKSTSLYQPFCFELLSIDHKRRTNQSVSCHVPIKLNKFLNDDSQGMIIEINGNDVTPKNSIVLELNVVLHGFKSK